MSLLSYSIKQQQINEDKEWEEIQNSILLNQDYDWRNAKSLQMRIGTNPHLYMKSNLDKDAITAHIDKLIDKLNLLTKKNGLQFFDKFKDVVLGNEYYDEHLDIRCLIFFSLFQERFPEEDEESKDEYCDSASDDSSSSNDDEPSLVENTDFSIESVIIERKHIERKRKYFVDKSFLWVRCDWMYPFFNTHLKGNNFMLVDKDGNKIVVTKKRKELDKIKFYFENLKFNDIDLKLLEPIINIDKISDTITLVPRCESQLHIITEHFQNISV